MKNITYLFGAGASYNACPIWKEQAEKMVELAKVLNHNFSFNEGEDKHLPPEEKLVWLIGYIGTKALEFNTVDTYAKKLYLQSKIIELNNLKTAVSCFFTIWNLTNNTGWKYRLKDGKENYHSTIDNRYINLLATYLEKGPENPKLQENIKFVTWNYDLQIENAYLKFTDIQNEHIVRINDYLPFIPDNISSKLEVCHLNGFYGFYGNNHDETLFKCDAKSGIKSGILKISSIIQEVEKKKLSFNNYINYAWESSEISKNAREIAKSIYSKTNILVVIGYSFPPFNHEIDKSLISSIKNLERLIIQDPNADAKFISETFGIFPVSKITVVNDNMDQFVIPNYIEREKLGISRRN